MSWRVQSTRCYHFSSQAFRLGSYATFNFSKYPHLTIQTRQGQVFFSLRIRDISQYSSLPSKSRPSVSFRIRNISQISKHYHETWSKAFFKDTQYVSLKKTTTTAVLPWRLRWPGSEVPHGKLSLLFQ